MSVRQIWDQYLSLGRTAEEKEQEALTLLRKEGEKVFEGEAGNATEPLRDQLRTELRYHLGSMIWQDEAVEIYRLDGDSWMVFEGRLMFFPY